ncbi:hypothetical protein PS862_04032 [Pseudomonas fluorescens]|uniref:Uncharacterized protein n=1 Tax=Pseudomonas fluorescens TaxID=294 RepID=A0A5E6XII7_PSEFL|nr:hypothetical protein [Pseudomonas fluorescens]VVN40686.1 hypothetical protein PS639_05344 [Pseudomonas fluorescens]VVP24555.1 hypothetical protein PS862_04032 [Pseudomonas fluorescens]
MTDERNRQNGNNVQDFDPLVAAALNAFDARLERLEKPEENTWLKKIEKKMSLLALLVGIVLSAISLFDVFWSKPNEERIRDLAEFNGAVNAVANLRQGMVRLQFESNNPQMFAAMNSMVIPQVLANIQYATEVLPRLGDDVGIPQLVVLISEAMNIYDWKSAQKLVDRAVATKNAAPSMMSEAYRFQGRLMFFTGRIDSGRTAYEQSLKVLAGEQAFGINATRAFVVSDWIMAELSMGDCSLANKRTQDFAELVRSSQIAGMARIALVTTLKAQIAQIVTSTGRCLEPPELSLLDSSLGHQ